MVIDPEDPTLRDAHEICAIAMLGFISCSAFWGGALAAVEVTGMPCYNRDAGGDKANPTRCEQDLSCSFDMEEHFAGLVELGKDGNEDPTLTRATT
ncbi:unnamed protein product [Chrysoparadoxa australica]